MNFTALIDNNSSAPVRAAFWITCAGTGFTLTMISVRQVTPELHVAEAVLFRCLFGVVFMSHQLGSFTGAWLGGYVHDRTGSYDLVWLAAVGFGLLAAVLHWPIREAPLPRMREARP